MKFIKTRLGNIIILCLCIVSIIACFLAVRYITQQSDNNGTSETTETNDNDVKNEGNSQVNAKYPIRNNITATVFWVGEDGDESNDFIQNRSSLWMDDWLSAYGGVDSPDKRCDYKPCGFTPKENPFYFALPYADTNDKGPKSESELKRIPWYSGTFPQSGTLLKNRWVKIEKDGKAVYAQWEDVGPFGEDDIDYVFGTAKPMESRAGIDLSPAAAEYLSVDGRGAVSWQFVDDADVPDGPWKKLITTSPTRYR